MGGLKLGTLRTFDSVRIPSVVLSAVKIPHAARKCRNIPACPYQLDFPIIHWKRKKRQKCSRKNYWYWFRLSRSMTVGTRSADWVTKFANKTGKRWEMWVNIARIFARTFFQLLRAEIKKVPTRRTDKTEQTKVHKNIRHWKHCKFLSASIWVSSNFYLF